MSNRERTSVTKEAICDVCDGRGWGGFVGLFEYDPDEPYGWTLTAYDRRESQLKAGSRNRGHSPQRPRTLAGHVYHGGHVPIRLRCPGKGHRLATLETPDDVVRLLEGATGGRVRLTE